MGSILRQRPSPSPDLLVSGVTRNPAVWSNQAFLRQPSIGLFRDPGSFHLWLLWEKPFSESCASCQVMREERAQRIMQEVLGSGLPFSRSSNHNSVTWFMELPGRLRNVIDLCARKEKAAGFGEHTCLILEVIPVVSFSPKPSVIPCCLPT